jgi:hypothetical protein
MRAKPTPSQWPEFILALDPAGLLSARETAVIRQLYQVLRQSGYRLKVIHQEPERPVKRATVE